MIAVIVISINVIIQAVSLNSKGCNISRAIRVKNVSIKVDWFEKGHHVVQNTFLQIQ